MKTSAELKQSIDAATPVSSCWPEGRAMRRLLAATTDELFMRAPSLRKLSVRMEHTLELLETWPWAALKFNEVLFYNGVQYNDSVSVGSGDAWDAVARDNLTVRQFTDNVLPHVPLLVCAAYPTASRITWLRSLKSCKPVVRLTPRTPFTRKEFVLLAEKYRNSPADLRRLGRAYYGQFLNPLTMEVLNAYYPKVPDSGALGPHCAEVCTAVGEAPWGGPGCSIGVVPTLGIYEVYVHKYHRGLKR